MCAAKQYAVHQHPHFALSQCAIKQYVYQYKEWQCVWNQHVAQRNAQLNVALNQYVAQQCNQSHHAAEKYRQRHHAVTKLEQCTPNHNHVNRHDQEENHPNHGAVEPFPIPHDVPEQYPEAVWDLNQYTNAEDCDFNQYAAPQYLVEQFPTNCYAGDAFVEEDVLNEFTTEQYAFSPYFVEECQGKDYDLKQLEVDNCSAEQYNPSQYAEKHRTAYHPFADEQCTLNQNASEQYRIHQYTDHWCTLNQYEEAQDFMYDYAVKQREIEEQYQQQFAYGHYAMNQYTLEQYNPDQRDPTQAAAGPNSANLVAFPHTQQFVAVHYAPYQYPVGPYGSDQYALPEQYFPQQNQVNQYPENVYVFDNYVVKQHTASQYRGDTCPLNQWPAGRFVSGQYETQHCVTEQEAQQHALQYYALDRHALEQDAWNQFEAEQCGLNQYATEQYAFNQFKAEQHESHQYLAGQFAINPQQHGGNQYRVGRNASGQCKAKRGVTNNSRAKQCSTNRRMSDICSTDRCPTQQDANTQIEEKLGAPEPDTNEDLAELSATKHDCKGKDTADLNVATQEATQWDSTKPRIAEQHPNNEKNQVPRLDSPQVVGTSSPHIAKSVDSPDQTHKSLEVTDCCISRQNMKPSNPDVATEVQAGEIDSPEQKQGGADTAEWDTAAQDTPVHRGTEVDTAGLQSAGQDETKQETSVPVSAEQNKTKQNSTGLNVPEQPTTDAEQHHPAVKDHGVQVITETFEAKQSLTEQRGNMWDAPGHNSAQAGASDLGRTVEAQAGETGADDADLDTVGPMAPERYEAPGPVTAEQERADHNRGVAEQGPSQKPPQKPPPEEDSAGGYRRRGTRSCRTGCSRASFNKGQSSRARYYSRCHYSTRYCND